MSISVSRYINEKTYLAILRVDFVIDGNDYEM